MPPPTSLYTVNFQQRSQRDPFKYKADYVISGLKNCSMTSHLIVQARSPYHGTQVLCDLAFLLPFQSHLLTFPLPTLLQAHLCLAQYVMSTLPVAVFSQISSWLSLSFPLGLCINVTLSIMFSLPAYIKYRLFISAGHTSCPPYHALIFSIAYIIPIDIFTCLSVFPH